ncbi:MAG: hypothetical protein AAFU65_06720, partial [Pseudomonadota bacterium]
SEVVGGATDLDCVFFRTSQVVEPCTDQPDFETSATSSGLIASSELTYRGERFTHSLRVERSVSPVGLGFLVETDRLNGSVAYDFSPRLSGMFQLIYLDSTAIAEEDLDNANFDRTFSSVDLRLNWRVAQNWSLSPGVRFRSQETQFSNLDADSQLFYVNLSYQPQTVQISR